jgi:recombination protein RecT
VIDQPTNPAELRQQQQRRQPQQERQQQPGNGVAVAEQAQAAVEKRREEQVQWLKGVAWKSLPLFERILPDHMGAETFVGLAVAALYRNPTLLEYAATDPDSLMIALREAASLGHMPGTDQYWLTPRKGVTVKGKPGVLGIEGYQGIIERFYRAGGCLSVRCKIVREADEYIPAQDARGVPTHIIPGKLGRFTPRTERGPVIGVYAYAILLGGYASNVIEMPMDELMEHRAKAAGGGEVWDAWPEAMYRKTALRQLEPYVPTSAEYRIKMAQTMAAIAEVAPTQPVPGTTAEQVEQRERDDEQDRPDPSDVVDGELQEART